MMSIYIADGKINISDYRQSIKDLQPNDLHAPMEHIQDPSILVGDLNCKNAAWVCRSTNKHGRLLQAYCDNTTTNVRALAEPTHFGIQGAPDILDIALVRGTDLLQTPEVLDELSSDHNPIVLLVGP